MNFDPRNWIILLVDDNEETCATFQAIMRLYHVQTHTVTTPQDALHFLDSTNLTLTHILLDLQLPDMTGQELLQLVRNRDHHQHTPVIAFSAETSSALERDLQTLGFACLIEKPFFVETLLRQLHNAIR